MLTALARTGSFDSSRVIGEPMTVFTQRAHELPTDSIRLDLVLVWSRLALELWIEAKTGSPLSPNQLGRYLAAQDAMSIRDHWERPPVVLLSAADSPLRDGAC